MGNSTNTDVELLIDVKDSLERFLNRVSPLKGEMLAMFNAIDQQLAEGVKRKKKEINDKKNSQNIHRTDTFVCNVCGNRVMRRSEVDEIPCPIDNCKGRMHRVYTDDNRMYVRRAEEELEEINRIVSIYNQQKNEFISSMSIFFTNTTETTSNKVLSLRRNIRLLEDYLNSNVLEDTEVSKGRSMHESTSMTENGCNNEQIFAFQCFSNLDKGFISKFPKERKNALNSAFKDAPSFVTNLIKKNIDGLNAVKASSYAVDEYGNFYLDKYGNRYKEDCHYSPKEGIIYMNEDYGNQQYAIVARHEIGHFIDDIYKISGSERFVNEFSEVRDKYYALGDDVPEVLENMCDDLFASRAAHDRYITDIISALTDNDPIVLERFEQESIAFYGHGDKYWQSRDYDGNSDHHQEKEVLANIFAIINSDYEISKNFAKKWFGDLYNIVEESLIRCDKNGRL